MAPSKQAQIQQFFQGNGRTQKLFITQLIRNAGYDFDFAHVDGDLLMTATTQSANGETDLLAYSGRTLYPSNTSTVRHRPVPAVPEGHGDILQLATTSLANCVRLPQSDG